MIRTYHDFILSAADVQQDKTGVRGFALRVADSPLGPTAPEHRSVPAGLHDHLRQLDGRRLEVGAIIDIGAMLADLLLGGMAGDLFSRCLMEALAAEDGLRLRLRLPPELALIPWEYMYCQQGGGEKDATGFLALDPRVSIARQETLVTSRRTSATAKARRMLVALASPVDSDHLDLARERESLTRAFRNSAVNIELEYLEDATVEELGNRLRQHVDILHFAGHGSFKETKLGNTFGTTLGEGTIVLVDEQGRSAPMPADQLAVNLLGSQVQLVVLGACESGKRDPQNVWSAVVTSVVEAAVPAAVAMQFSVWDDAAIVFARNLYQVMAAGLPLDYAVSEARRAVFNLCNPLRRHIDRSKYWRDWGVPVLYLQADWDFCLPAITDPVQRDAIELYYQGMDAYYRRDYDKALDYLRLAAQANADNSDAFEMIAHIQQTRAMHDINNGHYDAAALKLAEAHEAARQTDPLEARALALRGMVFKSLAQVAEGREDPETAMRQYARAARFFEQGLRLDPDDAGSQLGLGNVQHALYNQQHALPSLDAAIAAYSRATELVPRYTAAYHDLALAYEQKMGADRRNAREWCQKALAAWWEAYKLAFRDGAFTPEYRETRMLPRMDRLWQRCGPGK